MATNGMIKFKSNNEEKGLFTKFCVDQFGEVCNELTSLPTEALKKIMDYLKDNNGGYLDMFDPQSWCEYGYIIDLDKLQYDTYSTHATKTNPDSTTRRLNYVGTNHFDMVKEVEGEKHSLIITWDGLYKGLYDLPLTEEQTQKLANILVSKGQWFARNVFNSIAQDFKTLPETIPDDWIILDTNEFEYKPPQWLIDEISKIKKH